MKFDPEAAAQPGSGVFGLPCTREESALVLVPVPFDATTSYGGGCSAGPGAIREASMQVDLFDLQYGRMYERGMYMMEANEEIAALSRKARGLAEPIIAKGGMRKESVADVKAVEEVNRASEYVNGWVYETVKKILSEGKLPGLVGGDHSTPFGAIRACAESLGAGGELGILQIDAHMDLRDAYEGFTWSHASIMHNVLTRVKGVSKLVQVGIRDFGEGEWEFAKRQGGVVGEEDEPKVEVYFDQVLRQRMDEGEKWGEICWKMVEELPRDVYVSFDIDGLEPTLCPHTGTPVPGGLTFFQAAVLLKTVADSGRRVVGFDLNEVCPGVSEDEPEWDGNVGARVLYKLCGMALSSGARL